MSAGANPQWADPSRPVSNEVVEQHESELFSVYSTLDEPILETVMRDVHAVAAKLRVVMKPLDRSNTLLASASYAVLSQGSEQQGLEQEQEPELSENDKMVLKELKDWDLWGPLILCLSLSVLLSFKAPPDQNSLVFAAVFCAVWIGGTVVTINAQLLGGTMSFFQSVCVLGYSLFPLTLSALVIGMLKIVFNTWLWLDCAIIAVGFVWATRTSAVFISLYIKPERRFLALYPVFYFYLFMSWMILLF